MRAPSNHRSYRRTYGFSERGLVSLFAGSAVSVPLVEVRAFDFFFSLPIWESSDPGAVRSEAVERLRVSVEVSDPVDLVESGGVVGEVVFGSDAPVWLPVPDCANEGPANNKPSISALLANIFIIILLWEIRLVSPNNGHARRSAPPFCCRPQECTAARRPSVPVAPLLGWKPLPGRYH